jgi:hypothetical protein
MATKSNATRKAVRSKTAPAPATRTKAETTPKFPYTNKPGSLRRFLKEIPNKPKPNKFDSALLKSWGFSDSNDYSLLRVAKAVGLLNESNEPTETYAAFMRMGDGAKALAPKLRTVYAPLFQASHAPYTESSEVLKNLFNIHSGGGAKTLELQIQTFKALSDHADFNGTQAMSEQSASASASPITVPGQVLAAAPNNGPTININLHIHLPENKTSRDYEAIIEDIGRYIFGRTTGGRRE